MSEHQNEDFKKAQSKKAWFEKEPDEWDEDDEYEAMCNLFEEHH